MKTHNFVIIFANPPGIRGRSDYLFRSYIGRHAVAHADTLSRRRNQYVNKTDLLEAFQQRLISMQKKSTNLRCTSWCLNWCLKETEPSEMPKNVLPSTQKKMTHFSDQFERSRKFNSSQFLNWYANKTDLSETTLRRLSHWYVNKTDHFQTSQQCTNWYLSETDQLNTSQRRFNQYLNETDVFETSQQRISSYLWSLYLISGL